MDKLEKLVKELEKEEKLLKARLKAAKKGKPLPEPKKEKKDEEEEDDEEEEGEEGKKEKKEKKEKRLPTTVESIEKALERLQQRIKAKKTEQTSKVTFYFPWSSFFVTFSLHEHRMNWRRLPLVPPRLTIWIRGSPPLGARRWMCPLKRSSARPFVTSSLGRWMLIRTGSTKITMRCPCVSTNPLDVGNKSFRNKDYLANWLHMVWKMRDLLFDGVRLFNRLGEMYNMLRGWRTPGFTCSPCPSFSWLLSRPRKRLWSWPRLFCCCKLRIWCKVIASPFPSPYVCSGRWNKILVLKWKFFAPCFEDSPCTLGRRHILEYIFGWWQQNALFWRFLSR